MDELKEEEGKKNCFPFIKPGFTFCTYFRLRLRHFTAQDVSLTNDLLSRCYIGDWFLLHLLAKNTSTYMFRYYLDIFSYR